MHCDLCLNPNTDNININTYNEISTLPISFLELMTSAISDSYTILAINQTKKGTLSNDKNNAKPINLLNKDNIKEIISTNSIKFLNTENSNVINYDKINILNRITIEINDQKDLFQFSNINNNTILYNFDIVAIKPMNDSILENCLSREINCDIIVLDFDVKYNFLSKKHLIQAAIDKNIFFEIEYSRFIINNESRGTFISNFLLFNDFAKGKNIILSSGASDYYMHRSPFDICTIFETIFGLKHNVSKKMISEYPQMVVLKSKQRKYFKTTVDTFCNK